MVLKETMKQFNTFTVTQKDLNYWFDVINEEIFDGKLPYPEVLTTQQHLFPDWGYINWEVVNDQYVVTICLRNKYPTLGHFIEILAHEMVHLWQILINGDTGSHNKHFYSWKNKFTEHGLTLQRLVWFNP